MPACSDWKNNASLPITVLISLRSYISPRRVTQDVGSSNAWSRSKRTRHMDTAARLCALLPLRAVACYKCSDLKLASPLPLCLVLVPIQLSLIPRDVLTFPLRSICSRIDCHVLHGELSPLLIIFNFGPPFYSLSTMWEQILQIILELYMFIYLHSCINAWESNRDSALAFTYFLEDSRRESFKTSNTQWQWIHVINLWWRQQQEPFGDILYCRTVLDNAHI